jgi:hypothetical protein
MNTLTIRPVSTSGLRRLVAACPVDGGLAQVYLLTNEVELAGDEDVLIGAGEGALPYALLLERDLVGAVWSWQLGPPLDRIPATVFDRPGAGVPIIRRDDSRWDWKLSELAELHRLCATALRAQLD